MAAQNSGQHSPLEPDDVRNYYNAAVQFYNNEIEAIGTRTSAFFLTQSILIAALVIILTNQEKAPAAFGIIVMGIILIGFMFCALHTRAGLAGAKGAYTWRKYMLYLESGHKKTSSPWKWFTEKVDSTPKDTKDNNSLCQSIEELWQSIKEGNLVKYLPFSSTWVFSPFLFLLLWLGAFIYTIIKYGMVSCHHAPSYLTILFIIISVITLLALKFAICFICRSFKSWRHPPEMNGIPQ